MMKIFKCNHCNSLSKSSVCPNCTDWQYSDLVTTIKDVGDHWEYVAQMCMDNQNLCEKNEDLSIEIEKLSSKLEFETKRSYDAEKDKDQMYKDLNKAKTYSLELANKSLAYSETIHTSEKLKSDIINNLKEKLIKTEKMLCTTAKKLMSCTEDEDNESYKEAQKIVHETEEACKKELIIPEPEDNSNPKDDYMEFPKSFNIDELLEFSQKDIDACEEERNQEIREAKKNVRRNEI